MIPPPAPPPETICEARVPIMSEDKSPAVTRGTMLRNQAVLCHQKLLPSGGPLIMASIQPMLAARNTRINAAAIAP